MSKRKPLGASPMPNVTPTVKTEVKEEKPTIVDLTATSGFIRASALRDSSPSTPQSKRRKAIEDARREDAERAGGITYVKTERGGRPVAEWSNDTPTPSSSSRATPSRAYAQRRSYKPSPTPYTPTPSTPSLSATPLSSLPSLPMFPSLPALPSVPAPYPPSEYVPLLTLYANPTAPGGPAYFWGPVSGASTNIDLSIFPPTSHSAVPSAAAHPPIPPGRPQLAPDIVAHRAPARAAPSVDLIHAVIPRPELPPPVARPPRRRRRAALPPGPRPDVPAEPEPPLSPEQMAVLHRVLNGESIFFTGSAGTGKSVLLRAIIRILRERHGDPDSRDALAVTASTGMAAMNIGGCTLHSWAGIQLGMESAQAYAAKIPSKKPAYQRWMRAMVLIVDEVSMIHGELLDKLDFIGRELRESPRPFGGIQVVFCGDFFQLPPVTKKEEKHDLTRVFGFDSHCWRRLFTPDRMITLRQVFRQRDDRFVAMLERLRRGAVTETDVSVYKQCERELKSDDGIKAVRLYPKRDDVDRENRDNLKKLTGKAHEYLAQDYRGPLGKDLSDDQLKHRLNDSTRFPEKLTLKIGAQVMLVTNTLHANLVNGSMGRVVGFTDPIHEAGEVPASSSLNASTPAWPIVEFVPNRRSSVPTRITVHQAQAELQGPDAEVVALRRQVPLILAWAMTIHKAQGLTLDRVRVDVGGAFELGQVYVAISRVTSMEGLELVGFTRQRVLTSQRVVDWTDELENHKTKEKGKKCLVTSSP